MAERPATIPALDLTRRYFDAELARLSRPETREIDCDVCGGSGRASASHPNDPSPRDYPCDECDGSGKVNVRVYAIEEEDLFPEVGR